MDTYSETTIRINFAKGTEYTPIVVFEGVELADTKTFSNKTHQIEELLNYIMYNENGGCDVFI